MKNLSKEIKMNEEEDVEDDEDQIEKKRMDGGEN